MDTQADKIALTQNPLCSIKSYKKVLMLIDLINYTCSLEDKAEPVFFCILCQKYKTPCPNKKETCVLIFAALLIL